MAQSRPSKTVPAHAARPVPRVGEDSSGVAVEAPVERVEIGADSSPSVLTPGRESLRDSGQGAGRGRAARRAGICGTSDPPDGTPSPRRGPIARPFTISDRRRGSIRESRGGCWSNATPSSSPNRSTGVVHRFALSFRPKLVVVAVDSSPSRMGGPRRLARRVAPGSRPVAEVAALDDERSPALVQRPAPDRDPPLQRHRRRRFPPGRGPAARRRGPCAISPSSTPASGRPWRKWPRSTVREAASALQAVAEAAPTETLEPAARPARRARARAREWPTTTSFSDRDLAAATPIDLPTPGRIRSRFGYRSDPFTDERTFHQGLDISTGYGQPVHATAGGRIVEAGRNGSPRQDDRDRPRLRPPHALRSPVGVRNPRGRRCRARAT